MPYRIFLPLPAGATVALRSDVAIWRPGDGTKIGASLVEEVDSLNDISIGNTVQIRSRLLILVLLAHAAAQCQVSRKLGGRGRRTGNGRNSRERGRGRKREGE